MIPVKYQYYLLNLTKATLVFVINPINCIFLCVKLV